MTRGLNVARSGSLTTVLVKNRVEQAPGLLVESTMVAR